MDENYIETNGIAIFESQEDRRIRSIKENTISPQKNSRYASLMKEKR